MIWSNFATIIWEVLHKKTSFWALEKWKMVFRPKKMKISLGNIVCHSNMQHCAQYEIIWTNYAMNVVIRLIIWLESHESSHMIAHFWEHFFKIIVVWKFCYFSWKLGTCNDTMRRFSNFLIFFEFFMPISKCGQNGGNDCS